MKEEYSKSKLFQALGVLLVFALLMLILFPVEHAGDSSSLGETTSRIFEIKFAKLTVPTLISILIFMCGYVYNVSKPTKYRSKGQFLVLPFLFMYLISHYFSLAMNGFSISGGRLGIAAWRHVFEAFLIYRGAVYLFDSEKKVYAIVELISIACLTAAAYALVAYATGGGIGAHKVGSVVVWENAKLQFYLFNILILLFFLLFSDEAKHLSLNLWLHRGSLILSTLVIVLSARRNSLFGMLIAFGFAILYGFNHGKRKVSLKILLFGFIGLLGIFIFSYEVFSEKIVARLSSAQSLLSGEVQEGDTLRGHFNDLRLGWMAVEQSPIWGNGVDASDGGGFSDRITSHSIERHLNKISWVHCGVLTIWLQFGLLGVMTYIGLYLHILARTRAAYTKTQNGIFRFLLYYFIVFIAMEFLFPPYTMLFKDTILLFFPLALASAAISTFSHQHTTPKATT